VLCHLCLPDPNPKQAIGLPPKAPDLPFTLFLRACRVVLFVVCVVCHDGVCI
jgi:hypothetical protein